MAAKHGWKDNLALKAVLEGYVLQNMQRNEILDFMSMDFPAYPWSMRSLDRRLAYFNVRYIDRGVTLSDAKETVQKELGGPGALLGYRAMAQKLQQKHNMKVPRDLVYDIMTDLDPEGLKQRAPGAKKVTKGHFITTGSNWTHSLDGHDKLMGYQNLTFPLPVYGCIDTASRYLLWLRVWKSNSDPVLVGKWYLDALFETQVLANFIRIDKGTETTIISTMHAYLRSLQAR